MPSIKGTASVTDSRAEDKALKTTQFSDHLSKAVDVSKLNRPVFAQYIEKTVSTVLGFEDEIVESTIVNLFLPERMEGTDVEVDPKRAQVTITGFLGEEKAAEFVSELWTLMLDAANQPSGIPKKLLEEKKAELRQQPKPPPPQQQQRPPFRRPGRGGPPHRWGPPPPRHDRPRNGTRPVSPPHDDRRRYDRDGPFDGRRRYDDREGHYDHRRRYDEYGRRRDDRVDTARRERMDRDEPRYNRQGDYPSRPDDDYRRPRRDERRYSRRRSRSSSYSSASSRSSSSDSSGSRESR